MRVLAAVLALAVGGLAMSIGPVWAEMISVGPRPYYLIDKMDDGPLKSRLFACADEPVRRTAFSIAHRGAPLMFPEHTDASNRAAWRMGAGVLECDVVFTKDHDLVCRHAQNDLHTTTTILDSALADTCVTRFQPARGSSPAKAQCRTAEITLDEFRSLTPKMDAANTRATTVAEYLDGTANWRTDLYTTDTARVLTHTEFIALAQSLGAKMTPELKTPAVPMPHQGLSMTALADKMIAQYRAAGVPPEDVFPQSFDLDVIRHWIASDPDFGAQAVYLVQWRSGFDPQNPRTWQEDFEALRAEGLRYLAPSMNMLVARDAGGAIVPSAYARAARAAGLTLISWSLERSGPLSGGGGWYYRPLKGIIGSDGQIYEVLDVLARQVGIVGMFSDWPGTVSYYASCMGLK